MSKQSLGTCKRSPGTPKRSPGTPRRSPEKLKTLITLLFLSFERRGKNLCHNHIFRIWLCKKRFKVNSTFKRNVLLCHEKRGKSLICELCPQARHLMQSSPPPATRKEIPAKSIENKKKIYFYSKFWYFRFFIMKFLSCVIIQKSIVFCWYLNNSYTISKLYITV